MCSLPYRACACGEGDKSLSYLRTDCPFQPKNSSDIVRFPLSKANFKPCIETFYSSLLKGQHCVAIFNPGKISLLRLNHPNQCFALDTLEVCFSDLYYNCETFPRLQKKEHFMVKDDEFQKAIISV